METSLFPLLLHAEHEQMLSTGMLIPIVFACRTLTDAECRYASIEKECCFIVDMQQFCQVPDRLRSFEFQTDHKLLVPLMTTKDIDCEVPTT